MTDKELESFKTEIDLRDFAASLGFELNRRDSWRGSAVMERGHQDKIIVTRNDNGHHVYFSVKESHGGTIIDLAKRYVSQNFGEIRKALRRWEGGGAALPSNSHGPPLQKTPQDLAGVAREWHSAADFGSHTWLEGERAIPPALLGSSRLAGRLKVDGRGNVLFAHFNHMDGLCGFEKKNAGFTGFAAGGEKGLGASIDQPGDSSIVFAESFIDMLSYAALFPDGVARYRSFAGALSEKQLELIRLHILSLPLGSAVIAATDADEAGARFAAAIKDLSDGYSFHEHRPVSGDWNDVLRQGSLPVVRQAAEP